MIASIRFGPIPMPVAASPATGVRRGDERIRAVVEVEQRPLRALEQDVLARRAARGRRAATCRRCTAAAAARSPRSARPAPRARAARRRRRARARRSSRRARPRSSGAGSSGRAGPGRGCRAATPCRRRPGRSRAGSCRSAACRAAARSPWSIATCHGMIRCALPETCTHAGRDPARLELVELRERTPPGRSRSRRRARTPCRTGSPDGIWRILYVSPPTTIVWPAFGPPW